MVALVCMGKANHYCNHFLVSYSKLTEEAGVDGIGNRELHRTFLVFHSHNMSGELSIVQYTSDDL